MESEQEVRKEEAALSHEATHYPECCPSQFTWVVCGAEQSLQLFPLFYNSSVETVLRNKKQRDKHIHMMCNLYDTK